jgi:hypothetical protein
LLLIPQWLLESSLSKQMLAVDRSQASSRSVMAVLLGVHWLTVV